MPAPVAIDLRRVDSYRADRLGIFEESIVVVEDVNVVKSCLFSEGKDAFGHAVSHEGENHVDHVTTQDVHRAPLKAAKPRLHEIRMIRAHGGVDSDDLAQRTRAHHVERVQYRGIRSIHVSHMYQEFFALCLGHQSEEASVVLSAGFVHMDGKSPVDAALRRLQQEMFFRFDDDGIQSLEAEDFFLGQPRHIVEVGMPAVPVRIGDARDLKEFRVLQHALHNLTGMLATATNLSYLDPFHGTFLQSKIIPVGKSLFAASRA